MRFSDFAKIKLGEAKDMFGSYAYNDKGPEEVMEVDELINKVKLLSVEDATEEIVHLANRKDCALEPSILVYSILFSLDSNPKYEAIFENKDLAKHYRRIIQPNGKKYNLTSGPQF